jgi:WD40 repeat protein
MNEQAPKLPDLELIKVIGTGSYGEVWLARTVTGLYRAVKIVDRARFPDERPWLREFAGISRYQKDMGGRPRQLALLHVGEDKQQGIFYYVMELADDVDKGPDIDPAAYVPLTLKALCKKRPEMPLTEVLEIGISLTRSLAELHEAGLIHRDVKPSNIVFVQGTPKLADLGLVSSSDHTLTSLGTPGYSPPEVVATPRSDIFSLGRILYELGMQLPSAEFPRLPADLASNPDAERLMELNEILLTACNPDPQLRYKDAGALLTDLLHVQAGGSLVEMARLRERLARAAAVAKWAAVIVLTVGLVFGARHYSALRRLAAEEAAGRALAEKDEHEARYVADLQIAQVGAQASDYGIAVSALQRHIPAPGAPDQRGAEWWSLWNELRGDQDRQLSLGTPVRFASPTSDGKALLCLLPERNNATVLLDAETWSLRPIPSSNIATLGAQGRDDSCITNTWDNQVVDLHLKGGQPTPWPGLRGTIRASNTDFALMYVSRAPCGFDVVLLDRQKHREAGRWTNQDSIDFFSMALVPSSRTMAIILPPKNMSESVRTLCVDLGTGKELWNRQEKIALRTLSISPDGKRIAMSGMNYSCVVETETGLKIWESDQMLGALDALSWSPDSRLLAVGSSKAHLEVFDIAANQPMAKFLGAQQSILYLSWSPDGKTLTSVEANGDIRSFNVDKHPPRQSAKGLASYYNHFGDLLFTSQPGQCLATLEDNSVALIQIHPWKILKRWEGLVMPVANQQGGAWFALNRQGTLCLCQPDGSYTESMLKLPANADPWSWNTSPDQRYFAFTLNRIAGGLILWDLQTLTAAEYTTGDQSPRTVRFDQASNRLAVSDNRNGLRILDLSTRQWGEWMGRKGVRATEFAFTRDGKQVFVGYIDGSLQRLDLESRSLGPLIPTHHAAVSGLALLDNDNTLLSISRDGTYAFHRSENLRHLLIASARSTLRDNSPTSLYGLRKQPGDTGFALLGTDGSVQFLDTSPRK